MYVRTYIHTYSGPSGAVSMVCPRRASEYNLDCVSREEQPPFTIKEWDWGGGHEVWCVCLQLHRTGEMEK